MEEFLELLRSAGVDRLVDVRKIPYSTHNPQFNRDILSRFLRNHRINYRHMKALGGLRKTNEKSLNKAWRNKSFRGYADYMQTNEFKIALRSLIELSRKKTTAIMCAEAVPWRCHRSLIADALIVKGIEVYDILGATSTKARTLSPIAKMHKDELTYPL